VKWIGKWVALALLVVVVAGVAREPLFWKRYFAALGQADLPQSLYEPRELIQGGNDPPAPRVAPDLESLATEALEAAASYAGEHNSRALIVSRHGHIVFERYWDGTDFDTLENSQSFARVLAALVTGVAISDRKIGWPDEPIGHFISEWRNDPRGAITVRHLLQLSSGLRPPGSTINPWGAGAHELFGSDVIAEHLSQPLTGTPGVTWVDQRADSQLLALVIERATGQRYASYVSQALWRRIGAGDAWLWVDRAGGAAHADCGLFARQGDWIRVAELLLGDGNYRGDEVIRPGWVAQMRVPAKGNSNYGSYLRLGTRNVEGMEPYATNDVFLVEASGGNRLWLVPSLHIAILRTGGLPRTPSDWDDAHIPNLIIHGARDYLPPQAQPGADLSKLVPNH
jgi:CubicO group peptidase (beta-lactamase class C family)